MEHTWNALRLDEVRNLLESRGDNQYYSNIWRRVSRTRKQQGNENTALNWQ
jgi:hypothetical protein